MNEKELKELQDSIKSEQQKQSQAVADLKKATEDQKAELFAKYGEAEKKANELQTAFDELQAKMAADAPFGKKEDSFVEMKKAYEGRVKDLKEKNAKPFTFELKAIMDTNTNLSGSALATAVVMPFREQGVGKAPDRIPTLLDLIDTGLITSDLDTWIERSARTASAAAVSEGGSYAQSDLTYIQRTQPVERIGHYFKVQNRSLEDWDQLMSEIQSEGFSGLEQILEEYVYKGTGTTPQIQGITDTGIAAAFSSTALQGQIISPNHFDAIRAAVMQIRLGNFRNAGGVFINPADGAAFELAKTSEGVYVLPPFRAANGQTVAGCPIYESTLVTAGDVLVGDFKKSKLWMKRGIEIKVFEQNENDALYDRKTITVSCRAANRIKTPDYNAFVYDTFADIIAAIEKV